MQQVVWVLVLEREDEEEEEEGRVWARAWEKEWNGSRIDLR